MPDLALLLSIVHQDFLSRETRLSTTSVSFRSSAHSFVRQTDIKRCAIVTSAAAPNRHHVVREIGIQTCVEPA